MKDEILKLILKPKEMVTITIWHRGDRYYIEIPSDSSEEDYKKAFNELLKQFLH